MSDDLGREGDLRGGAGSARSSPGGRSSYVLIPQIRDMFDRLEWRIAAAIGSCDGFETVGHSADEAGVGPAGRLVTAINPEHWTEDLKSWYEEHYPGISYRAIVADGPWEAAIHLLPELQGDIALAQNDPRWEGDDFGEEPGEGTIGEYGGLLAGLAIVLRKVYGRDVTPPGLDRLLVSARAAFIDGNVLLWDGAISLFSAFDDSIKDEKPRSAAQLEKLLGEGWEIVLREPGEPGADEERFAYLEQVAGDVLHVVDTWDGERRVEAAEAYRGMRAAHVRELPGAPTFESLGGSAERAAGPPLQPVDHGYVLLPRIDEAVDRMEWRVGAAIGGADALDTLGHWPDDVGAGRLPHRVIAVNPAQWTDDRRAWYEEHRSEPRVRAIQAGTPWEMAVKVLPRLQDDIALGQTDRRWADYDFGEHPDVGVETIGRYGCFLTGLAMILRRVYRRDVTPPVLDKLLVAARSAYIGDNLMAWRGVVPLFPVFDQFVKDNKRRSALELRQLLDEGWEIILRRADGGHFVYLEGVEGETLRIIDPWDGKRKRKAAGSYAGIRAARVRQDAARDVVPILVGLHDEAGGEWMVDEGMVGCCVIPRQIQRQPVELDFERLSEAGLVVIGRLSWGYADGTGTLPTPRDREVFVDAVVETMRLARGVDYFHIGNDPNNRREWPGFGGEDPFALTPEYVAEIYNDIWRCVEGRARMGPPPVDPYFGPGSDNREWWTTLLEHIEDADVLFLHAKTQTNDPDEVWSKERFSDWPLKWQYLHLSTVESGLEVVPDRFQDLPVFVSELNPQCLRTPGGDVGWLDDNADWVRQAVRYFREETPVTGVAFYRYGHPGDEPFSLQDKPVILEAIKEEGGVSLGVGEELAERPLGLPGDIWRKIVEAEARFGPGRRSAG
ncbi:MAG: hypothetical protein R6X31_06480 [Anaerolineae bacterium]